MTSVTRENFLAVALVINRSRDGPAFVFHYPPDVQPAANQPERLVHSGGAQEDILLERLGQPLGGGSSSADGASRQRHRHDDYWMAGTGSPPLPWERVAGFPTRDLASILTPARSYDKKLFQLSLDPIHCISYPIHVPEDGKWKRNKKIHKANKLNRANKTNKTSKANKAGKTSRTNKANKTSKTSKASKASKSSRHTADHQLAPHEAETPTPSIFLSADAAKDKDPKKDGADDEKRSSMTMFNLVFILNPRKSEGKALVDALYPNVVKKVNKALKYSQYQYDFVWKESKRILSAKDRAREERKPMAALWKELIQTSSLASSLHDIYEAVCLNKIATLHLETPAGILTPSFQIPAPFFVSDIPSEHDNSPQRGLWLTTANSFLRREQLDNVEFLDKNFALLLLEDEKKIIAELEADQDTTTPSMVEFARLAKPTMSFHQVCQSKVLTPSQVREYAQHFIFWRRAIAVPPLHDRDVYIVSPNCDVSRLPQDTVEWQRAFPQAPTLPNFLSELSQAPRPFKSFCPSKPQRPLYLSMLAWLLRGGWVTQLCTFAYVVVWPEILYEVAYEMEAEELAAAAAEEARSRQYDDDASSSSFSSPAFAAAKHHASSLSLDAAIAPSSSPSPTPVEVAAEQARLERIALKASREAANKATAHARKIPPLATPHPSLNDSPHLAGLTPHIILDAKRTTGRESRYLATIAGRFRDEKLRGAWHTMCRYFDGANALERIALQEGMRKKDVWVVLTAMSEYLICTRHW
ncbi:hypothetical protein E4U34_001300 [Claviceps purpurea]|nr:hypothetical protein E4U37_001897 [Claviceps purpurea]KAG6162722.1 hypothetical protein E4U11_002484 [Claviceps purpurea]KAG6183452.1 hypothetical protein E4U36_002669 [Claviceps purpurea]KAG6214127.1 hypothetical protein E4U50_000620 [Claviceps purpurea]KAG6230155.1 hypothetical protein E4U34_001300 [Claviceps purpurea]